MQSWRSDFPFTALSLALLATACSSESSDASGTGGRGGSMSATGAASGASSGGTAAGGTAGGAVGGAGSDAAGSGGGAAAGGGDTAGSAGTAAGGAAGSGGMTAGGTAAGGAAAGSGGMAAGGTGGAGGGPVVYKCTRVIGASVTKEWYTDNNNYFETLVPNEEWELKAALHAQLERWADPNHGVWAESGKTDAIPIVSPCAGGTAPDRVVFVAIKYAYTMRAEWDRDLPKVIQNIKDKYPSVKRIELMTNHRCSVTTCPETADDVPPASTCRVFSFIDEAIAAAAAAAQPPGFVVVGPKVEHDVCADFDVNTGHMKGGPGRAAVAKKIADYYTKP